MNIYAMTAVGIALLSITPLNWTVGKWMRADFADTPPETRAGFMLMSWVLVLAMAALLGIIWPATALGLVIWYLVAQHLRAQEQKDKLDKR